MRAFFITLLFLSSLTTAIAQITDTVYLNDDCIKVLDKATAHYIRITNYKDSTKTIGDQNTFYITGEKQALYQFAIDKSKGYDIWNSIGVENNWYKNGQLKMAHTFDKGKKIGKDAHWYENGQIYNISTYVNGKRDGEAFTYYPDGKVKRKELFAHDSLLTGMCFTKSGTDTTYFPIEKKPEFPGGEMALNQFLRFNIHYPMKAIRKGIEGIVLVQFIVDKSGIIRNFEVVKKVAPELDNESLRIVKKMPMNWAPAEEEGKPVTFKFTLPVRFALQ